MIGTRYRLYVGGGLFVNILSVVASIYNSYARVLWQTIVLGTLSSFLLCMILSEKHLNFFIPGFGLLSYNPNIVLVDTTNFVFFSIIWAITFGWGVTTVPGILIWVSSECCRIDWAHVLPLTSLIMIFSLCYGLYRGILKRQATIFHTLSYPNIGQVPNSQRSEFFACIECLNSYSHSLFAQSVVFFIGALVLRLCS